MTGTTASHYRMIAADKDAALGNQIDSHVENMLRLQMETYPQDWSDEDKRAMAEKHLLGEGL